MMKWFLFVFFTIITSNSLLAQENNLEIKSEGSGLFLEHTVVPKENFYSIGRMYNVQPKELASYNHLQFENGLAVGAVLKIPLAKNNFTQTKAAANAEALVPVYHTVALNETLYRLGIQYHKVPLASLKKWNHLQSDEVTVGSPMIVGYLKVDKNLSPLPGQTARRITEPAVAPKEDKQAKEPEAVAETAATGNRDTKTGLKGAVAQAPDTDKVIINKPVSTKATLNFYGGFFKKLYDQQTENKTPVNNNGSVGVFKSTSGWQDGKYYCFNNDAAPGTVLKITDNTTGKSIYAKVLDAIPDIKQNGGLTVVLSNAAVEELGADTDIFDCVFSYSK